MLHEKLGPHHFKLQGWLFGDECRLIALLDLVLDDSSWSTSSWCARPSMTFLGLSWILMAPSQAVNYACRSAGTARSCNSWGSHTLGTDSIYGLFCLLFRRCIFVIGKEVQICAILCSMFFKLMSPRTFVPPRVSIRWIRALRHPISSSHR